ncbi:MAG: hypothetical protein M1820_005201 [Bogoriella megaspora]|nr:MAG: hypothetical protein M1820_005201 [Bogoriella megaspora]
MDTAASPSSNGSSRPTLSCVRCVHRKVKCDRQRPCSSCVKHKVDCVFNPPQPLRKRAKRVKVQVLEDRLKHYEALLQEHGVDSSELLANPKPSSYVKSNQTVLVDSEETGSREYSTVEADTTRHAFKPQIIRGQERFKFVENLWTRVVEEFHDSENTLEDSNDSSDPEISDDGAGFVLRSQSKLNIRLSHPSPERIHQFWEIFVENVDPLTKIIHVPTLELAIQKAASNIDAIPRSFEALMFAIFATAVMSLKDTECIERFFEPRKTLLSRYISATEAALSRARFMGTTSLVTLQALVLHLLSVREIYEPRAVWTLTGVAVRIAQGMGLERDGESLGLPPFETEIRRRVWWQLKMNDFRTAELCGLAKFRDLDVGAESTKWPTNVSDNQLYPGMPSLMAEPNTLTDIVFVALRCELVNFAADRVAWFRQQEANPDHSNPNDRKSDKSEIGNAFMELDEIIETKYLRYCDPSEPLHLMTMLVARLSSNVVRFMTHHPRRWASIEQTPTSERRMVWEVSIKLLEQQVMVQSNPLLKRFAWHAPYFRNWHAFIHVLDTLRADPVKEDADNAWQLIGKTYENTPDMILDMKKPIHVAVGNLCLKAYSDREIALQNESGYLPPTPEFISQLRKQREVAKAKKQARNTKTTRSEDPVNHAHASVHDSGLNMDAGHISVGDHLGSNHFRHVPASRSSGLAETGYTFESDPFHLDYGFNDSHGDNLDMDFDFTPPQDLSVDMNAFEYTTWEQWDAWLADSNMMRPLSS